MPKDEKRTEEAIKLITMGAKIMGWDMMLPKAFYTGHIIIGSAEHLERLQASLRDEYEVMSLVSPRFPS